MPKPRDKQAHESDKSGEWKQGYAEKICDRRKNRDLSKIDESDWQSKAHGRKGGNERFSDASFFCDPKEDAFAKKGRGLHHAENRQK